MRKIITVLVAVFLTTTTWAQSPQKLSYQAVIRDGSGSLISSHSVGIRISILQGTTPVFVETHATTTNVNGLASVEIGNGTFVSGLVFSNIDWSAGAYSIKTETDPSGGTNYLAIVGTSPILSVPYALYSKTAETTINETDPNFIMWDKTSGIMITSAQVSNFDNEVSNNPAVLANTAKNSYPSADSAKLAGINGSETILTAGTNVTVTGTGTTASPYVVNAEGPAITHYKGELFGGGIVVAVWIESGVEHGLIASLTDLSSSAGWSSIIALIGPTAQSPVDGQANTNAIVAQGDVSGAAYLCNNYTSDGFSDWYLPATWELNQCYQAALIVNSILGDTNGFQFANYWNSTENIGTSAWYQAFNVGNTNYSAKQGTCRVRAVRRF